MLKQESKEGKVVGQQSETHYSTCILSCKLPHRFVECSIYMQKSVQDRRQLINDNQRCYICLGMHMARNCNRKNEDGKCSQCGGRQHHRTLCSTVNMDKRTYSNPDTKPFEGNQALQSSNNNDISGSVATSKSIQNEVHYSTLVIVNVKSTDGVWIQANCFLDMGSDTTLVRKDLVNNLGLPELGSSKLRFGTAGGNVHEGFSKDFMLEVKPLKSSEVSHLRL